MSRIARVIRRNKRRRAQKCVVENGGVLFPQSLPTASQEARRELEQPRASFASLAALPYFNPPQRVRGDG